MDTKDPYVDALELVRAQGLDRQIEEHIRQLNDSLSASARAMTMSSISHIVKDAHRQHDAFRTILGPMEDWRTNHLLEMTKPIEGIVEAMEAASKKSEARFTLPNVDLYRDLIKQIERSHLDISSDTLIKAASEMRNPWLDIERMTQSFAGFAELQNIGHALAHYKPFDDPLIETLRSDLGDWREKIAWPETALDGFERRSEFYAARGFKKDITDFPAAAFVESLEIAGFDGKPPSLLERYYGPPVPHPAEREEVVVFRRSSKTYEWLYGFETHLRNFIDAAMTRAFGQDWPRHRLPNGLYDQWVEKKTKAERTGSSTFPLICYADFTDYERVILKSDNWNSVFAVFFLRKESIRESLQRLYPPRVATMHARPISQADELFVYVEVKRLLKALSSFNG